MNKKFFALLLVWTFALSGAAFAQVNKQNLQNGQLANALPVSDGVVTVNMQRLVSEALPQALSGNQTMLADVLSKIDEVKNKTGVDLRQFETIAVGVSSKKSAAGELNFAPVILARGGFNAASFVTLAKIAANSKYREEKIGTRSVYIFSPRQLIKSAPKTANPQSKIPSVIERALDKMFDGLSNELAVASFDDNTLAIGSVARLRETFGTSPRLNGEVLDLISRKPNAVMNFSLKLPGGLSSFVKLDNDELGKTLDSVRFMAGAVDVGDGNALVSVTARTLTAEQAQTLQETLDTFQMFGKAMIGSTKINGKEIYARLIDNARIVRDARDVTLDLAVPQSDINALLAKFVKPKVKAVSAK